MLRHTLEIVGDATRRPTCLLSARPRLDVQRQATQLPF